LRFNLTFLCLVALCACAQADVIRLKNGKTIVADSAHESNGRIEYTIGDNSFAIPGSLVEKIDTGGPPPVPATRQALPAEQIPDVRDGPQAAEEIRAAVVHGGKLDLDALKNIEDRGVPEKSSAANFVAAQFEERQNNIPAAARYLQVALNFTPDDGILLEHYAAVLLRLDRKAESVSFAERATHSSPPSGEAFAVLGYAYYENGRSADAIAAWKRSLALRPSPQVMQLLALAQRESKAEADFRQQESNHFVLHYEGSQVLESLRAGILRVLETQYDTLQSELGVNLRNSISVSIYTDQAFFDVTQAPAWTSALNDGKIRIPVSGLTTVTPELTRVLRHELTHSFIAQMTHGNVPTWLNEGIAQLEEPATTARIGLRLATVYASGNQIPLNQLEDSFLSYSTPEAIVAYAESLGAAECIRNKYGMADLSRILQRLGEGEPIESALRSTIHSGYAQFEAELADYLKRNYGQ
jgi:tetratricopeptide (TPR) repeat protein